MFDKEFNKARLLIEIKDLRKRLIELDKAIQIWAGRPTKDGAKKLRELSYELVKEFTDV